MLTGCLSSSIWLGDVGFRSFDDLYVFSRLVVLASPRRVRWIAPVMAIAWSVFAIELVTVL